LVANKNDLYENEEVTDNEGMTLAKEIEAIFQRTSAKEASGIEDLFNKIAKRILDPTSENTSNLTKEELEKKGQQLMRDNIKNERKKKKCC
jgi:50S ribosomal subunit-associated GTPase HflX